MDAIVFGTGNYYKTKKDSIEAKYNVVAYIDIAVKPGEAKIFGDGKKIYNPTEIERLPKVPILLMSAKFMEMYERLHQMGVDNSRIVLGTDFYPAYDTFEETLAEINGNIKDSDGELVLTSNAREYKFRSGKELEQILRKIYRQLKPEIDIIRNLPTVPVSGRYGRERGTPIDRYYIESFLEDNKEIISGDIGEFADNAYTKRFGTDVRNSYILHVNGWGENVIKANLVTGEGVEENRLDCLICTQTIQFIYELENVVSNIYRLLKNGGVALITAHGISQLSMYDYRNWGEYWRFTEMSFRNLFVKKFGTNNVEVRAYGNVKTSAAMLYGLCIEDLNPTDFETDDEQFPLIVAAKVRKGE